MSNWQVGDIAIIVYDSAECKEHQHLIGSTCTLVKYVGYVTSNDWAYCCNDAWQIDIVGEGGDWFAAECCLRKPYDPFEPGSWEDMKDIFTPKELEIIA